MARSAVPRTTKSNNTTSKRRTRGASGGTPRGEHGRHEREGETRPSEALAGAEGAAEAPDNEVEAGPDSEVSSDGADAYDDADAAEVEVEAGDAPASVKTNGPTSIERFDALSTYLREVQKHPLLSPEETQALAERFVATQDAGAAARLVTANLRLVVKIAYEYRRAYKNIMDLIQEGNIGLMQAVKRYDPYRGVKLSSYAAWWIRAYILRFILNNWRLVKLGTTQAQRKLFFNLRKKRAELQAMGVDPTDAEIAKQLNVPESEVAEMDVRLQASEKSLDAPIGDGEGRATAKIDTMPSLVQGPEALMADSELQGLLQEKLGAFRETLAGKDKELAIFDERLVSDEPLTLQELGDRFGISRERVRQLEQRLTGRLRDFLREEMGDAVEV
ncbi:MAG: RNA polymerase factor sigma-32 [Polyangiaceae bacterium]|nr:RNA polymerase factor sigma-32 [Polyangiaceae bacterium]